MTSLGFVSDHLPPCRMGLTIRSLPQPTRPMMPSNVGGDRNALRVPIMSDGLRSWSYELFDCFSDLPTCMYSLWTTTHYYMLFPAHWQLQASCRVAVAAMSTRRTSSGLPTLTCMAHPFASQLEGTTTTVFRGSFFNAVSARDGDYRFVLHSRLLRYQILDMCFLVGHIPL